MKNGADKAVIVTTALSEILLSHYEQNYDLYYTYESSRLQDKPFFIHSSFHSL